VEGVAEPALPSTNDDVGALAASSENIIEEPETTQ
jgi:hypothetical protein